jgi:hypothetical protein
MLAAATTAPQAAAAMAQHLCVPINVDTDLTQLCLLPYHSLASLQQLASIQVACYSATSSSGQYRSEPGQEYQRCPACSASSRQGGGQDGQHPSRQPPSQSFQQQGRSVYVQGGCRLPGTCVKGKRLGECRDYGTCYCRQYSGLAFRTSSGGEDKAMCEPSIGQWPAAGPAMHGGAVASRSSPYDLCCASRGGHT